MSDSRAFTKKINPSGSNIEENNAVHQSSPSWVLTFVRWSVRDTLRTKGLAINNETSTSVRDPLVVENDCLSCTVTSSKGTLTPSMSATLVMTDVNYETLVAPGDFVMVNMLNWPTHSRRVANAARAKKPINGELDGFKGVFKVQSIRRILTTDPQSGTRIVVFKITAFGFTEFNNTIYFNPYLIDPGKDPQNVLLFASFLGENWQLLVNQKGFYNVQDIISVLIQSLIGTGIREAQQKILKDSAVQSQNVHFFMPALVGSLLGLNGVKAAKDIYRYIFGIQDYSASQGSSLAIGMNPANMTQKYPGTFYTARPCYGNSFVKPEFWNQVKTWSILNQYTNSPLNEIYTCFRISPNGQVLPTLVFRQIPFTNEDYAGPGFVTKYMNLPRWKINPALILEQDIGREEAARINFVQYFGRSTLGKEGADISAEIAKGNYVYDIGDVQRSGLRPYIVTTQFDDPSGVEKEYRSPIWAKILGDALIGGHLKMNGSILTAGLVEPIAVGDNLELDGIVYHIEQVSHTCGISIQDGKKTFRTTINLSSGISVSSSAKGTRYAEMTYTNAHDLRVRDSKNNAILPGVSEAQDTVYRLDSVDYPASPNSPYIQPNTTKRGQTDNGDDT